MSLEMFDAAMECYTLRHNKPLKGRYEAHASLNCIIVTCIKPNMQPLEFCHKQLDWPQAAQLHAEDRKVIR